MSYSKGSIISHPSHGEGVIVGLEDDFYNIYFNGISEVKDISKDYDGLEAVDVTEAPAASFDVADIEAALEDVLYKNGFFDKPVAIADKWNRGTVELKPGDNDVQGKEIPMETFYKKIVSVREKLRVLEQNINNHEKLDENDKLNLQQYISRAYGSLTTFNVLFKFKDDHFKGMGK